MSFPRMSQCKHTAQHARFHSCSKKSSQGNFSQEASKLQLYTKSNEERLKEKIDVTQKILKRYRIAEKRETEKLFPILEKISKTENQCYGIVGVLLGKYVSLERWGALTKKSGYILEALLRHETQMLRAKQELTIKEIEYQIKLTEHQTEMVHGEGDHLIDYACTSYAEMVMTIEEIRNYKKLLQFAYDWEHAQIMKQYKDFEKKIVYRVKDAESGIKAGISKEVKDKMEDKTLRMQQNNIAMREILNEYNDEMLKRQEILKTISKNVKVLQNDPGNDARKKYFPEMYYHRPDCTPDMELKLDIPIKTYIPI